MRYIHQATLTVFVKPEDNPLDVRKAFEELVPLKDIPIQVENAIGFNERKIQIFTMTLLKIAQTTEFLRFLLEKLGAQKTTLEMQKESRLDEDYNFFIRLDKKRWMEEREVVLTESGDCFHIKLTLAVYPKKRELALNLVQKLLSEKNI